MITPTQIQHAPVAFYSPNLHAGPKIKVCIGHGEHNLQRGQLDWHTYPVLYVFPPFPPSQCL